MLLQGNVMEQVEPSFGIDNPDPEILMFGGAFAL